MPSTSKSQQRLMGVAYAVKSGDMQLSDVDSAYRDKVKELVDGMSLKDLKDFASTPHEGLPEVVETITPESIGGMGNVQLPTENEFGSGDVPAGPGDAKKRNKKKMKFKHKISMYEEFLSARSQNSNELNEAKFKTGDKWEWKHIDGNKTVEITDIKPNGDVVARVEGDSQEFILREPNKYLKTKVNESTEVNEARSINKIQKDYTTVTSKMKEVVDAWKAAEGSAKDKLLAELKDLTTKKKALERELDEFVMGKDADLELVVKESLSESMMAEIDIIAQEAKDFKDFAKKVTKEFKLEDDKDLFAWLKSLYDNRS